MYFRKICVAFLGGLLAVGFCVPVQASLFYTLGDHPDGDQNPPPYGLRLDHFLGAGTGVYSWQFDRPESYVGQWQQAVLEVTDSGTVHIYGNMYGGKTNGDTYDANKSGLVEIDYHYHSGYVSIVDERIVASNDLTSILPGSNGGTLTDHDGWFTSQGSLGSSVFEFFDKAINSAGTSFIFDNDGHRLASTGLDPETTYVGRGWHMFNDGTNGTRDFLFTATAVPEPSTMLIWTVFGLACSGFGLRRRNNC